MTLLLQILSANFLTRVFSIAVATLLSYRWLARASESLLTVACGLLSAVAIGHLIPESFSTAGANWGVLAGVMVFTVVGFWGLERLLGHADHAVGSTGRRTAAAMLAGAALHNFVDGVLVAGTFLMDVKAGWLVAVAVILHEIPQSTGYMVILKNCGFPVNKALRWCAFPASAAVIGGAAGWWAVSLSQALLPYALAVSAASFLFITFHGLLPEVIAAHRGGSGLFKQVLLFLTGVALSLVILGAGHGHGHDHDHSHEVSPVTNSHRAS